VNGRWCSADKAATNSSVATRATSWPTSSSASRPRSTARCTAGNFVVTYESIIPNLTVLRSYKPLLQEFWREGLFEPMDAATSG
jgi:hypothetical protein